VAVDCRKCTTRYSKHGVHCMALCELRQMSSTPNTATTRTVARRLLWQDKRRGRLLRFLKLVPVFDRSSHVPSFMHSAFSEANGPKHRNWPVGKRLLFGVHLLSISTQLIFVLLPSIAINTCYVADIWKFVIFTILAKLAAGLLCDSYGKVCRWECVIVNYWEQKTHTNLTEALNLLGHAR